MTAGYLNISGAALNSNKSDGTFQVNAAQYTSHYKNNRALSILPVQADLNSNKYRNKKPIPSNNTYVSVEGFLDDIETDTEGHATRFHVSVDNIGFLGRATFPPSPAVGQVPSTPSRSFRFKFNFEASSPVSASDTSGHISPLTTPTPLPAAGASTRAGKHKK